MLYYTCVCEDTAHYSLSLQWRYIMVYQLAPVKQPYCCASQALPATL